MNTYNFNGVQIRTIMIGGAPLLHATDVCRVLGLSLKGGTTPHTSRLARDEKVLVQRSTHAQTLGVAEFLGTTPSATAITESGLNKLVMRSDKPEAVKLQDWVARDVLPSIRKTGGYLLNEDARQTAHADTREEMPLADAFNTLFGRLIKNAVEEVIRDNVVPLFAKQNEPTWVSKDGKETPISKLPTDHLRNIRRMLKADGEFGPTYDAIRAELTRRNARKAA